MRVQFKKTGTIKKRGREFQYTEEEREEARKYRVLLPFKRELDAGDIIHYLTHETRTGIACINIKGFEI